MKTLTISTLALFAFACAPEANNDQDELTNSEMDAIVDASLNDTLARSADEEAIRVHIRKGLNEVQNDIDKASLDVVGMIVGIFDKNSGTFKGTGYGGGGQQLYIIDGDYAWSSGPEQIRVLEGTYVSTVEGEAGDGVPTSGQIFGEADDGEYFAQQIAAGHAPLFHEGLWIDPPTTGGDGIFIGLVAKAD